MRGDTDRYKVISRDVAYHGTTLGALTITSLEGYRQPFEPLVPGAVKVPAVNFYRAEQYGDDFEAFASGRPTNRRGDLGEGPETVAAVFLEPVQNAGGCFTPRRNTGSQCARSVIATVSSSCRTTSLCLRSTRHLVRWSEVRLRARHHHVREGHHGRLRPARRDDRLGPLGRAFQHGDASFVTDSLGPVTVSCAVALKSIEIMENEKVLENVLDNEDYFRQSLLNLKDIPIVGDVRGTGYFWGVELVKNQVTKETWAGEDAERLLRGTCRPRCSDAVSSVARTTGVTPSSSSRRH